MSAEDKKIQYTIEAIDETEKGLQSASIGMSKLTAKVFALNQTFDVLKNLGGMVGKTFSALYSPASQLSEAVEKQSQILGLSTKEMQKWNFVATQNKASVDSVTMGFTILTSKAYDAYNGNKAASDSFKSLGISVADASGNLKSNETLINDTVRALSSISSESERSAKAQDLFGRSGRELLPLLAQGKTAIDDQRKAAENLGQVLSQDAVENFTATGDALDALKTSTTVAAGEFLNTFLPAIKTTLEWTTKLGAAIGNLVRPDTEVEGYAKKIAEVKDKITRADKAPLTSAKTKQDLQDELAFYERYYNMALKISQLAPQDKQSSTVSATGAQKTSSGDGKKQSFDDYASSIGLSQMNIDAAIKQAEEQQAASKASQDKIAEYIKKTSEETLKDAEEKGQKWQELQSALAESNASAKGTELEQQYAQLELWKTKELELYAGINDSKSAIDKMYDNKKAEIEKNAAERAKTIADKEKQMKIQNFQQVGGAFNDLMGAIGQATKENAKAQKAIAIVQAIINTALGVTQAIAQGGVAGIVTGALVAATGAIQIATIASQNFALGGVAQRNPGAVSDSVNVNVNPDERIVTKRQQNNLTRFLNNPDSSSGRGDTYNIFDYSGNLVETLITQIQNGQADRLSRTLNSRFATA